MNKEHTVIISINGKEEKYLIANFHNPDVIMDRLRISLSKLQGVSKVYQLWEIEWTEYELGWGCRLDGKTYYLTKELADKAIKKYIENSPKNIPEIYSEPSQPKLVDVPYALYEKYKNGDKK